MKKINYLFNGKKTDLIETIYSQLLPFSIKYRADYHLFEEDDNTFSLGIGRTSHSGGYFYEANFIYQDGFLHISGEIVHHESFIPEWKWYEKLLIIIFEITIFIPRVLFKILFIFLNLEDTKKSRRKKLDSFFIEYIGCKKNETISDKS